MATREIQKTCDTHGAFTTGSNRGECPKCKEASGTPVKTAKTARQDKTRHSKRSPHPTLSPKGRGGKGADGAAVGISLDFAGYPDLLTDIEAMAAEQFRSVEMQIVYMLNQAMRSVE